MVIDGAGWHRSGTLKAPDNIYLLKLPPYAPELNPIEHVWDELREKFFHNRVFVSLNTLEDQLALGLKILEENPETVRTIVSWDWIVTSTLVPGRKPPFFRNWACPNFKHRRFFCPRALNVTPPCQNDLLHLPLLV